MTREQAARFIGAHSDIDWNSVLEFSRARKIAYRIAAKKLHPDAGGTQEEFQKLQEAIEVLNK